MTTEVQKYDDSKFGTLSAADLGEALKEFKSDGKVVTFNRETDAYVMRVMPPYKNVDGRNKLYSTADMHFNVPVPNPPGDLDKVTTLCARSKGERCLVCEHSDTFKKMGVWGEDGAMGCKPTPRIRMNVILKDQPERGIIIFQDGISTVKGLASRLEDEPDLLHPMRGAFVRVKKVSAAPWREVTVAGKDAWVSLDAIDGIEIEDAEMDNLPDLDESWEFPSLEDQYKWFNNASQGQPIDVTTMGATPAIEASPVGMFDDIVGGTKS